jgi:hypothetical protein
MFARVNTFERYVVVGKDANSGKEVRHQRHEYTDTLENIYRNDFLNSFEYEKWKSKNPDRKIGLTLFKQAATKCKCIGPPKMRCCVDETETNFEHALITLKHIRRSKVGQQCECVYCTNDNARRQEKGIYIVLLL